ncbi:MAG: hypothetical protein ABIH03_06175 [Pseudomonadota bacterium]
MSEEMETAKREIHEEAVRSKVNSLKMQLRAVAACTKALAHAQSELNRLEAAPVDEFAS